MLEEAIEFHAFVPLAALPCVLSLRASQHSSHNTYAAGQGSGLVSVLLTRLVVQHKTTFGLLCSNLTHRCIFGAELP